MSRSGRPGSGWKRAVLWVAGVLLALIVLLAGTIWAMWHNEILTLASITHIRERDDAHRDGSVYRMQVKGGFYLDEFVEQGGVKSDAELIDFITGRITRGLMDLNISAPDINCSSFTAKTPEGDVLFARNYDFYKTNTCIVYTEANKGRHASVSTVDMKFLDIDENSDLSDPMDVVSCLAAVYAPLDGVNDAGVSCGIYMTLQGRSTVATDQNTDKPDCTSTTLLRMILDYADDLDEAVEIASAYDLHDSANTSYHYMVADPSGRSAVLEWVGETDATDNDGSARTLVVHYSDDDAALGEAEAASDYQWVTNFILQPGYYDDHPGSRRSGLDRYERIYEELSKTDGVVADERAAMDILGIIGRRTWDAGGSMLTVHSVVYNLTDRTALWVPNERYDDPSAYYELSVGR